MRKLAIIYHSAHGHTEHIARHIHAGANDVQGVFADLLRAEEAMRAPEALTAYDAVCCSARPPILVACPGRSSNSWTQPEECGSDSR